MKRTLRIGAQIGPYDPFWVQVREAVYHKAQQFGVELIPIEIARNADTFSLREQANLLEELLGQKLDALICWNLPETLIRSLLGNNLPSIYLAESDIRHPLFVSPEGLYDAGKMVGLFLAERLKGHGRILCVGGMLEVGGEDGSSRLSGLRDALDTFGEILWEHSPSYWRYEQAYPQIKAALEQFGRPVDALFGLSDSLALAARNTAQELGVWHERILIAGVNGDPQALAAIAEGSLTATVETSASEFGARAMELAFQATQGMSLPEHFGYQPRLITTENVNDAIKRKLVAIADLPSRLVGVNRQLEQERVTQLETSAAINRRVGVLLDRKQLCKEIANLIRTNYGYDHVQILRYSKEEQSLTLEQVDRSLIEPAAIPADQPGPMKDALDRNEAIFIPDAFTNTQYPPDPFWPDTRVRVVLPIRLGSETLGLLDLHSRHYSHHLRTELIGLQALADQLGVAIRNSELYAEAVEARAIAEKANLLKTRLLANIGHELRAPLNIIMGYSQSALRTPSPYPIDLPAQLVHDQQQIYQSGEHLMRLINDLLDLSRAEIDELDLYPENISTKSFLEEAFHSMADTSAGNISWKLSLPKRLPVIHCDPVRFRQILLNLLSNARKFTNRGEITLGAEVAPPHLHFWVKDTGLGIPVDLQERVFEPFVTIERPGRRIEGIGLGLSITRRLVALHRGTMCLESCPGQGSVFHVYLPLPSLSGKVGVSPQGTNRVLLVISAASAVPDELLELSRAQGLSVFHMAAGATMADFLREHRPCALAWDLAHASLDDWRVVENLRSHPDYCHLPFIIYDKQAEVPPAITSVLTKPVSGRTLIEYIHTLRPTRGPVLIVDDDPEARTLYQRLTLEALPGCEVLCAENGVMALRHLAEITPSLVILDLMMPEMDGFPVLEKIRANTRTHSVPVLVMSGKLLSQEDIKKLDYAKVVFQRKELLSTEETMAVLQEGLDTDASYLPQPTSLLVKKVLAYLHQNYMHVFNRQEIADAVGVSEDYLSHIFRAEVGMTPWDCLNRLRTQKAKELLLHSSDSITMIAYDLGFGDSSYFSRVFRKHAGLSPQAYRNQASS
jgi:signal transduction histidine kinase/AraC-like DNA-binding protein/ABC-type sugar transport system substrate-binding protein